MLELDLKKQGLAGKKLLCAVSGGADSVALMHLLSAARDRGEVSLCAAHYEHGIRGEDSAQDLRFVQELCKSLNVPLIFERGDVPREAKQRRQGLETCARELRHEFLERARRQAGADYIALAHHRRDQAETVLMHIMRGSGLGGAAGIRRVSGHICRPLLDASPEEIREYLTSSGYAWREDATNQLPDNPRNALRLSVLPALRQIYPGCEEALARFAELADKDDRALNELLYARWPQIHRGYAGIHIISRGFSEALVRRALKRVLPKADYDTVERAISARGWQELGARWRAWGDGESIYVLPPQNRPKSVLVDLDGRTILEGVCALSARACEPVPIRENGNVQVLDRAALSGACLRLRREGDFICPLGMGGRRKSLGDYLTDRRFPLPLRERLPVIARGGEILWAPGAGISESVRVTPNSSAARLEINIFSEGGTPDA